MLGTLTNLAKKNDSPKNDNPDSGEDEGEITPPSHGGGEGASQEKTRCNHSPNAHKENTLIQVFQEGGGENTYCPYKAVKSSF